MSRERVFAAFDIKIEIVILRHVLFLASFHGDCVVSPVEFVTSSANSRIGQRSRCTFERRAVSHVNRDSTLRVYPWKLSLPTWKRAQLSGICRNRGQIYFNASLVAVNRHIVVIAYDQWTRSRLYTSRMNEGNIAAFNPLTIWDNVIFAAYFFIIVY